MAVKLADLLNRRFWLDGNRHDTSIAFFQRASRVPVIEVVVVSGHTEESEEYLIKIPAEIWARLNDQLNHGAVIYVTSCGFMGIQLKPGGIAVNFQLRNSRGAISLPPDEWIPLPVIKTC